MRPRNSIMLDVGGKMIPLSRDSADAVVAHLWKGLEQGAVTAAARLERAASLGGTHVEFPPYETYAVQDALESVGLPKLVRVDP